MVVEGFLSAFRHGELETRLVPSVAVA
jgi:hypothetical protein